MYDKLGGNISEYFDGESKESGSSNSEILIMGDWVGVENWSYLDLGVSLGVTGGCKDGLLSKGFGSGILVNGKNSLVQNQFPVKFSIEL